MKEFLDTFAEVIMIFVICFAFIGGLVFIVLRFNGWA